MRQNDAVHAVIMNAAMHLTELLDGGASVYVLKLTDSAEPMEFDLTKREDLTAISRFLIRNLINAANDFRDERDAENTLANDAITALSDGMFDELDRDKDRGGAYRDDREEDEMYLRAEEVYRREHPDLFTEVDSMPPPDDWYEND